MNSEWRDMAAYVARLEREREELRAALEAAMPDLRHYVSTHGPGPDRRLAQAERALSSGERTESGR